MSGKLEKYGNRLALVLDEELLKRLRIDENTPLSISTDGHSLLITPEDEQGRFRAAVELTNQRYSETFRKLAE